MKSKNYNTYATFCLMNHNACVCNALIDCLVADFFILYGLSYSWGLYLKWNIKKFSTFEIKRCFMANASPINMI